MKTPTIWIALFVLLFLVYLCSQGDSDDAPEVYIPDSMDAYVMAKKFVEQSLKAPSTAEFASFSESKIQPIGGDNWEVSSFVDSQNGFGAMIRTHFVITMSVNRDTKYWQTTSIKTDP